MYVLVCSYTDTGNLHRESAENGTCKIVNAARVVLYYHTKYTTYCTYYHSPVRETMILVWKYEILKYCVAWMMKKRQKEGR